MQRADCIALDEADSLAGLRAHFRLEEGLVYLDGNSLGPLPHAVATRIDAVVNNEWGKDLIRSWNTHDWIDLPRKVGEKIAPLLGAAPGQVICADSTSVNLFKLLAAGLALNPGRRVVMSSNSNFPTDLYMAQGLGQLVGEEHCELKIVDDEDIPAALDNNVAILMLTHVDFRSGAMHDMQSLTRLAHESGALVLWDLAHSAGAVPLALDDFEVDMAVGCGYKFLNGGPGAPAFLYVAERHQDKVRQPLAGWMGHAAPFEFKTAYRPAPGIAGFAAGTPAVISMAAMDAALDVWQQARIEDVRSKSIQLSELFRHLVEANPALTGLEWVGERDLHQRGSQVGFHHPEAYAIVQALIAQDVIGDFREPDIMRFGICPLYLRFVDVFDAVARLADIVGKGVYRDPGFSQRSRVT